jgi:hypothetical protein
VPTVLWCHGFRADALAHATELDRCAEAGFLAVGIDAVGHGARPDATIPERIREAGGALPVMLAQAARTIGELPALVGALTERFGGDHTRMSLVGISLAPAARFTTDAIRARRRSPGPTALPATAGAQCIAGHWSGLDGPVA